MMNNFNVKSDPVPDPIFPSNSSIAKYCRKHDLKIIHSYTILREGWEMDNIGVIVLDAAGKAHLVTTNHNSSVLMDDKESIHELNNMLIPLYERCIEQTKKAKLLLKISE